MKTPRIYLCLLIIHALLLGHPSALTAATFTSNTLISPTNTNFDGEDIVVIGCTVTIDGNHAFSDVLVLDNGVITHSFSPGGLVTNTFQVIGEQHTLSGLNPSTLGATNVAQTSIVVTGFTNSIRYASGTDYTVLNNDAFTLIERTPTSTIPDGLTVVVSYTATSIVKAGLTLTVTNNVIIDAGCAIFTDGCGYGGGLGSGAGGHGIDTITGGGGGYGGLGGASSGGSPGGTYYGTPMTPLNLGSGGGAESSLGGAGGGAIKIVAGGAILIDGRISANGINATNYGAGAGAGGSIWLEAPAIGGLGDISANGGAADPFGGGGGGGGRIALSGSFDDFFGGATAYGGPGATGGGAGTIFLSYGQTNQLFVDNGGLRGSKTPLIGITASDTTIAGGAVALISGAQAFNSLVVSSNSSLIISNGSQSQMTVRQNVTIHYGGAISADGQGPTSSSIGGAGGSSTSNNITSGTGGGHGGYGGGGIAGIVGGGAYDQISTPSQPGSIGGAGAGGANNSPGGLGGGVLGLSVSGTLQLDGVLSANGTAGKGEASGGGSGGGIMLSAGSLTGGGLISANGGLGVLPYGGGGGGGIIAISATTNHFTGGVVAHGGLGFITGGAGTVMITSNRALTQLVIENGGQSGTNTPIAEYQSPYLTDITIANGAVAVSLNPQSTSCRNLLLYSNSFLVVATNTAVTQISVMSNATVQAGCAILADGRGYRANQGSGAGQSAQTNGVLVGSGGSHAGYGGNGVTFAAAGTAYDSINVPESAGSGGGNGAGNPPFNAGGAGGGSVYVSVGALLTLNGAISANGNPGVGAGSGGGAGGSLHITAHGFTGAGTVSANGGAGQLPGGGGGGGRISVINPGGVTLLPFNFSGTLSASGGAGYVRGGAGTIFTQSAPNVFPTLIIDNGGAIGTNTPITSVPAATFNLTISGGAIAALSQQSQGINNITIGVNSYVTVPTSPAVAGPVLQLNVISNVTIMAGGGILLDGRGFPGGQGQGSGLIGQTGGVITGGGGGHGGYGGMSASGGAGGTAYDSYQEPNSAGSGGGNGLNQQYNPGGAGGGGVRLTMTYGTLILNGSISANGNPTVGLGAGGGSGGSIWVTAAGFSGAGSLSANGGAGNGGGGGGGGGRIYVSSLSNSFTGTMSAHGGNGYAAGGAGTIFTSGRANAAGQLIVDNGGLSGTNTLIQNGVNAASISVSGGAVLTMSPGTISATNLSVAANSFLTAPAGSGPVLIHLFINGNANIEAGGGILLDGRGYPANAGPGAGIAVPVAFGYAGGGAGHGGNGGPGLGVPAGPGTGSATGSILQPVDFGSGGGNGVITQNPVLPGAGGGALEVNVTGTLTVDGAISARGMPALAPGAGGGSGGSVWLTVGTLAGAGSVAVDGGGGNLPFGGGGAGGRFALNYTSNRFSGTITAAGGQGFVPGGAGTVYSRAINKNAGQLAVNNGGLHGAYTPLTPSEPFALSVSDGATTIATTSGAMSLGSLVVGPGGVMTQPAGSGNVNLTILGNALVDTNGAILADGDGYSGVTPGPGAGIMSTSTGSGSGAGYGGAGGASASGTPGGLTYGSSAQPTAYGSRGGINPAGTNSSAGGGAIELNVAGTLTVNGIISADGNPAATDDAGGGSGGSVWLTSEAFAGSGLITANGGAGDFLGGGGGGGGRVAIYSGTSQYTGIVSADGGSGFNDGQAGSIVYTNQPEVTVVLLSPNGNVTGPILTIAVSFNSVVLPLTASNFVITTPTGVLPASAFVVSQTSPAPTWFVTFPSITMTNVGVYTVEVIPPVENVQGLFLKTPFTGTFTIIDGKIIGVVTDPNGSPVENVTLQPSGGLAAATTDGGGNFSMTVPQSWSGTLTPYKPGWTFVPAAMNFANVTTTQDAQTIVALPPTALAMTTTARGESLAMGWYGVGGLTYQLQSSTDMINWTPYGSPIAGVNANLEVGIPTSASGKLFFRFTVSR